MTKKKESVQKLHDDFEMTEKEEQEYIAECHHEVTITTTWDVGCGEMVMDEERKKYDADIYSLSLGDFDKWDHISKIDYLQDLQHFVQLKIDEVHSGIPDFQSAVLVDMMGAPEKSNGQRYLSTSEKEEIVKKQEERFKGFLKNDTQ